MVRHHDVRLENWVQLGAIYLLTHGVRVRSESVFLGDPLSPGPFAPGKPRSERACVPVL